MTTELEQQLRDGLDVAARRFETPPDLRDRVDRRVALHRRRRRARTIAAGVSVLGLAAVGLVHSLDGGRSERVAVVPDLAGQKNRWVAATDENLGWDFEHPRDWTVQHFTGQCRIALSGTFVTNVPRPVEFQPLPAGCTTRRDLAGVPGGFVAVQLSRYSGGPAVIGRVGPDTSFPLSVPQATSDPTVPNSAAVQLRHLGVVFDGDGRYAVDMFQGPQASANDLAALERIVASIRPSTERRNPDEDGQPLGDTEARVACQALADRGFPGYATDVSVAAGFSTVAGDVVQWLSAKPPGEGVWVHDPRVTALPADRKLALCYFDGNVRSVFGTAVERTAQPGITTDRFVMTIDASGETILIAGTVRARLPLLPPD